MEEHLPESTFMKNISALTSNHMFLGHIVYWHASATNTRPI